MEALKRDFLLKEYESLRSVISTDVGHQRQSALYAVLASAAVWAWLSTSAWAGAYNLARIIPVSVSSLALLASLALHGHVMTIARYIRKIEDAHDLGPILGWEHDVKRRWMGSIGGWGLVFWSLFWLALIGGNGLIAKHVEQPRTGTVTHKCECVHPN